MAEPFWTITQSDDAGLKLKSVLRNSVWPVRCSGIYVSSLMSLPTEYVARQGEMTPRCLCDYLLSDHPLDVSK